MSRKVLRAHQERAIALLRDAYSAGHRRVMLQAPVAFGKTLVAATITRNGVEKGKRVTFIVDALSLIDQTVKAFWAEGVRDVGVIQGEHPMRDWSKPVQIASVQTLERRNVMPPSDIVIVDEAHFQSAWLLNLMARPEWRDVLFVGLSATPWSKGLGNHWHALLKPATMRSLTDTGFILPVVAYAPHNPDLTGVRIKAGEFDQDQLSKVMRDNMLVADIVETWKALGESRPTFCFCVDRAHAQVMQERFQAAGVGCGYIDGNTPAIERDRIRNMLDAGEIRVVASVGALIKGVDWVVSCIISAAPTKSPMKWVQAIGRGVRKNPPWEDCILLDHAGNTLRKGLGLPVDIDFPSMCKAKKGEKSTTAQMADKPEAAPKKCGKCSYVKPPKVRECPRCGFAPHANSDIDEGAGNLVRIGDAKAGPKKAGPTPADKERFFAECLSYARAKGKSDGWAAHCVHDRFGHWPTRKYDVLPQKPSPETLSWITAKNIRYAKGRGRAAA